ncbi:MAG: hypothetical protein QXO15_00215 [Nitrososphaerota archaeon]
MGEEESVDKKLLIKEIAIGAAKGILLYTIIVHIILPFVSGIAPPISKLINPAAVALYIGVIVSFETVSFSIKPCIGVVFDAMSALLVSLMLFHELGAGVEAPIEMYGVSAAIMFESRLLILSIAGFIHVFAAARLFKKIISSEE